MLYCVVVARDSNQEKIVIFDPFLRGWLIEKGKIYPLDSAVSFTPTYLDDGVRGDSAPFSATINH